MRREYPFAALQVIGYTGQFAADEWPVRLSPAYRHVESGEVLVEPVDETAATIAGEAVTPITWDELVAEGEVTPIGAEPARPQHLLWLSQDGVRYQPLATAEEHLAQIARRAVVSAVQMCLHRSEARRWLLRALSARPTLMAHALFIAHLRMAGGDPLEEAIRGDLQELAADGVNERIEWQQSDAVRDLVPHKAAVLLVEELTEVGWPQLGESIERAARGRAQQAARREQRPDDRPFWQAMPGPLPDRPASLY